MTIARRFVLTNASRAKKESHTPQFLTRVQGSERYKAVDTQASSSQETEPENDVFLTTQNSPSG